jgi:hypothetical protein
MARSEHQGVTKASRLWSARRARLRPLVPFSIATVVAALAVVAIAAPRFHHDVVDPNDTRGLLDVKRVRLDHEGGTEVTVITFDTWTAGSIWDRGNAYVFLDTEGGDNPEYFALVRSIGSDLRASLWRDRRDRRDKLLRRVAVRRKSKDSASVSVPIKSLKFGPHRESYFWWATTTFTAKVCRRTCVDRAPNDGSLEQWRPGMSPSPSPSPDP